MISASSLERVAACPGSERLPQASTTSADAARGTAVHQYLANAITGRSMLAGVPAEYHELCAAMDLSSLPRVGKFAAEVAYAWHVANRTARVLDATDRAYVIDVGEIPGTADAVGVAEDRVVIIDWKGAWSKATSAAENLQLRFYALCAATIHGKDSAVVAIARVAEDRIRWDVAELSAIDLDLFADELTRIVAPSDRLREGEHCRYCPAFDSCPAKQGLLRAARPEIVEAHAEVAVDTMDDGARAEVWDRLRLLEEVVERAKERLRESIRRRPIRRGDKLIAAVEQERRTINVEKALALAPQLEPAVKRSLTITDAEKILGKKNLGVIADAVNVSKFVKFMEVKSLENS